MEFMILYILIILLLVVALALVALVVWLGIKGLGYILSIWLGSRDNVERR